MRSMLSEWGSKCKCSGLRQMGLWHRCETSNSSPFALNLGIWSRRSLTDSMYDNLCVLSIDFVPSGHVTVFFPYTPCSRAPTHSVQSCGPQLKFDFFSKSAERLAQNASMLALCAMQSRVWGSAFGIRGFCKKTYCSLSWV